MILANALTEDSPAVSTVAKDAQVRVLNWLADAFWNVPSSDLLSRFSADDFIMAGYEPSQVNALRDAIDGMDENDIHDAAVDHTMMFSLGSDNAPLPYESVYTGSNRQLMKPVRDDVFALYQKHGYIPLSDDTQEPEDHVSHELRFLASVLENEDNEAVSSFLDDHAHRWMPVFAKVVHDQAATGFYKTISTLMI